MLGKVQKKENRTLYRVFRILKEKQKWIEDDKIEFDETIPHHIFINSDKLIFISASWNIYVYNASMLIRLYVLSNQLLPNSLHC